MSEFNRQNACRKVLFKQIECSEVPYLFYKGTSKIAGL